MFIRYQAATTAGSLTTAGSFVRTVKRFSSSASLSMTPVYSSSSMGSMAAPLKPCLRISIALRRFSLDLSRVPLPLQYEAPILGALPERG